MAGKIRCEQEITLFEQGEVASCCYFIHEGSVLTKKKLPNCSLEASCLRVGEFLAIDDFLANRPYSFTARTKGPTVLSRFDYRDLNIVKLAVDVNNLIASSEAQRKRLDAIRRQLDQTAADLETLKSKIGLFEARRIPSPVDHTTQVIVPKGT